MSAQRQCLFVINLISDPNNQMPTFISNLNTALISAGYTVLTSSSPAYTTTYPLTTTGDEILTNFTNIVTSVYPSGQNLNININDFNYFINYNY